MTSEKKRILLICFLLLLTTGVSFWMTACASIIHGSSQRISVSSSPSGAKVIMRSVNLATTPAVIELHREDPNMVLRFEKDGYEPVEVAINRDVDSWIIGNIVFGGILGLAIDFIDGAAYKLSPSEFDAVLTESKKQGNDLRNMPKNGIIAIENKGSFIYGKVTDKEGSPIPNVIIKISQGNKEISRTFADNTGTYSSMNVASGLYEVKAWKKEYFPQTRTIEIINGLMSENNFSLIKK